MKQKLSKGYIWINKEMHPPLSMCEPRLHGNGETVQITKTGYKFNNVNTL